MNHGKSYRKRITAAAVTVVVVVAAGFALVKSDGLRYFALVAWFVPHHRTMPPYPLPPIKSSSMAIAAGGDCGRYVYPQEAGPLPDFYDVDVRAGRTVIAVTRGQIQCGIAASVITAALQNPPQEEPPTSTSPVPEWHCDIDPERSRSMGLHCANATTSIELISSTNADFTEGS